MSNLVFITPQRMVSTDSKEYKEYLDSKKPKAKPKAKPKVNKED